MAITRFAEASWQGSLLEGSGSIDYVSSGAFSRLPVTWASRTEDHNGRTSPEELIAAAHAGCFSMALSGQLANAGMIARSIETEATLTLEKTDAGFTITTVHLDVTATIPGAEPAAFTKAAENAKAGCPVSRVLKAKISMDARLVA